jgi:ABC-type multidrug transport system ATPase subunit
MLTGMLEPSAGSMTVFGKDVSRELSRIREDLGVCPQHDVLWPELTVREHLNLFAAIKGVPTDRVQAEVLKAIADVGLTEKVHTQSARLSGGQKRKLSTAIALLGGSRVVVLDEPSSGMDPYSRRSLWSCLENAKKEGRALLLVTHFLDEADVLGSRVAVMANGRVQCNGTPMFLKQAFGVGYILTLVKALDAPHGTSARILDLVRSHVPEVTVGSDVGAELALRMPLQSSAAFPVLFGAIDERARTGQLAVVSYGVGITTLEDIFLKVAHGEGGLDAEGGADADGGGGGGGTDAGDSHKDAGGVPSVPVRPGAVCCAGGSAMNHGAHGRDSAEGGKVVQMVAVGSARATAAPPDTGGGTPAKGLGPSVGASAGADGDDPSPAVALTAPVHGAGDEAAITANPVKAQPTPTGARAAAPLAATVPSSASGAAGGGGGGGANSRLHSASAKHKAGAIYARAAAGGCGKHGVHFRALFLKRVAIAKRDVRALVCQIFIPVIMIAVGLALLRAGAIGVFPEIQLTTAAFNVNARVSKFSPQDPNIVPMFAFKSSDSLTDAAGAGLRSLVAGMPEANASCPATAQFDVAGAAAIPDPYGLVSTDAPQPTRDWQRMSAHLLNSKRDSRGSKYGAYVFTEKGTFYPQASGQDLTTTAPASGIVTYSVLHNTSALHAAPLFMNLMNSRLYAQYSGQPTASITVRNSPLPLTKRQATIFSAIFSFFSAALIVLAFAFIPASYAIFVIKERETKSKHQQLISGVSIPAYWLATFVFDVLSYIIPAALAVAL